MSFKAISFSLVAAAALVAQPAFAQAEGGAAAGSVTTATIGGVALPLAGFTVVAVGAVAASSKTTTATATQ